MPTIHTPDDLIRLVRENAEFREALRRELLTDELLALPQRFSEYAEATDRRLDELTKRFSEYAEATDRRLDELTKRFSEYAEATDRRLDELTKRFSEYAEATDRRLDELTKRFSEYAEATDRRLDELTKRFSEYAEATDRRLDELTKTVAKLVRHAEATDRRLDELTKRFSEYAEATDRRLDELTKTVAKLVRHAEATDRRLDALEQGQQRLEQSYQRLERGQRQHTNDIAELKGIGLETRLYNRGISQIATLLRVQNSHRIRVAERDDNSAEFNNALYEALEQGVLSEDEYARILDTDMVVRSNRPGQPHQVYVPIEASYSVSRDDIDKVIRTAGILDRLFPDAEIQPCLYFMSILDEMRQDAAVRNVHLIQERRLL